MGTGCVGFNIHIFHSLLKFPTLPSNMGVCAIIIYVTQKCWFYQNVVHTICFILFIKLSFHTMLTGWIYANVHLEIVTHISDK